MTTNTGNDKFTAIRFTAQKHKLGSPFNKAPVTANTSPPTASTTAAGVDPLPWLANSVHHFWTDASAPAPSHPAELSPGLILLAYAFTGQVTTSGAGNVILGLAETPGGPLVQPFAIIPVGAGAVVINSAAVASLGIMNTVMYPVFSFDVDVTVVTEAPVISLQYFRA
jgi:hypothetical protein